MNRISLTILGLLIFILSCVQKDQSENNQLKSTASALVEMELPKEIISLEDSSKMMLISYGEFTYGIRKSERDSILKVLVTADFDILRLEISERKEYLNSYYIDKFEITNKQYAKFIEETGHREPRFSKSKLFDDPSQPVVGLGWEDAKAYAAWSGKRLPSEEEWEKAARGTDGRIWPWGNNPSGEKYNGKAQGYYAPIKVGSFPEGASPYGVMDMAGNVYEMTTGKWNVTGNAMRGGSFLNAGALTRTMFRWAPDDPENGDRWLGFRCVMDTTHITTYAIPSNSR